MEEKKTLKYKVIKGYKFISSFKFKSLFYRKPVEERRRRWKQHGPNGPAELGVFVDLQQTVFHGKKNNVHILHK